MSAMDFVKGTLPKFAISLYGQEHSFEPQDDLTVMELAKITVIMANLGNRHIDWLAVWHDLGPLQRHFPPRST